MNDLLSKRFAELKTQAEAVEKTTQIGSHEQRFVDDNALLNWTTKAANLLLQACGTQSGHIQRFAAAEAGGAFLTNWDNFQRMKSVFLAASEDFEGGYLKSIRGMVQAEVFDSELEQAMELLRNGYYVAAAIIAGVVLETALRGLCSRYSIGLGKLDKMNADLCKSGAYNILVQKRITALAALRNSAAHGINDQFTKGDVEAMLPEVERILSQHLS